MEKGNVLQDFWDYCSCYEIPKVYAWWSALGLLGAVVNRKVFVMQGDIRINSTTFILLVGPQGNSKSTTMRFAKQIFERACPDIPIGPSQQSREDIVKFMSSDDCAAYYDNEKGIKTVYSPYHFFINEFKNFVSYNPSGMISFLTDIYDEEVFRASTLIRGREDIMHPAMNILACENPDWLIKSLKSDVLSGGFSRRINFIYTTDRTEPKPRPHVTVEARAARDRIYHHLMKIKDFAGEMMWTREAEQLYDKWYFENRRTIVTDSVMAGYYQTKHMQLLKLCSLLVMSNYTPKPVLLLTPDIFIQAQALMEMTETNLPKLFISAGRNELAAPQQKILDLLDSHGGVLPEREVLKLTSKDLNPGEQIAVLGHLKQTQEIFRVQYLDGKVERWCYMNFDRYKKEETRGNIKAKS